MGPVERNGSVQRMASPGRRNPWDLLRGREDAEARGVARAHESLLPMCRRNQRGPQSRGPRPGRRSVETHGVLWGLRRPTGSLESSSSPTRPSPLQRARRHKPATRRNLRAPFPRSREASSRSRSASISRDCPCLKIPVPEELVSLLSTAIFVEPSEACWGDGEERRRPTGGWIHGPTSNKRCDERRDERRDEQRDEQRTTRQTTSNDRREERHDERQRATTSDEQRGAGRPTRRATREAARRGTSYREVTSGGRRAQPRAANGDK